MSDSSRQRILYALAFPCAAAPVAFGALRAASTRSDFRYLWLAVATFIGVALVMKLGHGVGRSPAAILTLAAGGVALATAIGGATSILLLHAHNVPIVWIVACAFGCCWGAAGALLLLSRR